MAVILQKMVGTSRGLRFYPDFAGVARSHNFYPVRPMRSADGVAAVALGLGATVVDGEPCLRFCPRFPQNLLLFSSVKDALKNSQREFYALRLDGEAAEVDVAGGLGLGRFDLGVAERTACLRRSHPSTPGRTTRSTTACRARAYGWSASRRC